MRTSLFAAGLVALFAIAALATAQLTRPTATRIPASGTLTQVITARPIHIQRNVNLPQSQEVVTFDVYQVPKEMRLVIEYITFGVTAKVHDGSAVARLKLGTTCGGVSVLHDVFTVGGPFDYLGDSKTVRLYADAGSRIQARIDRHFMPPSSGAMTISGYLEPLSTPFKADR